MKKWLFFSLTLALVLNSCQDKLKLTASTANLPDVDEISLTVVGKDDDGSFKFSVSESSFLTAFLLKTRTMGLQLTPTSLKVLEIENKKFLRIYSDDDYVSTFALILDKSGHYSTSATMCTSQVTYGEACIPDGMHCKKIVDEFGDVSEADCTRSTTLRDKQTYRY